MNKKVAIIISPNYKDYAERFLTDCFKSLSSQDYPGERKIFIVDNATSEESYACIKNITETQIPPTPPYQGGKFEIIRNKNNDGFAKGNNEAMKLALGQGFDYIVLFNMDTVIEANCISKMVAVIENPPYPPFVKGASCAVGAVQARIMLYDDKQKINSLGNVTHFLGFGYSAGYGLTHPAPVATGAPLFRGDFKEICYPSGAAVLFTRDALEKVGLFDEEFWMYNEDQDLGWRLWLAGYQCVLAPEAVVYHKYEFSRSASRYYWLDRNRILSIWKNYHLGTLLLVMPAFIIMELGLILFSFNSGWFKEKLRVWAYFFDPRHWQYLIRARRQTQGLRKIKDRDIVSMFSGRIWYQEIDDIKLRLINPVFGAYWQLVKKIIWW
jgi:GT2 family glycosyltransferase